MRTGLYRPNLRYEVLTVRNEPDKRQQLVRLVRELDGTGIIYAASVKQVDLLHRLLNEVGFMVARDHRRMPTQQRKLEQARFVTNKVQAIVAMDGFAAQATKPDVRFTVHYAVPDSLDAYYEQSGCAGTDNLRARCVLLYDPAAARAEEAFFAGHAPPSDAVTLTYQALQQLGGASRDVPRAEVIAAVTALHKNDVRDAVAMLKAVDVIDERRGLKMRVLRPHLDETSLARLMEQHAARHGAAEAARHEMLAYAETTACRWKTLLHHFGEAVDWERCGTCDNCRTRRGQPVGPRAERSEAAEIAPAAGRRGGTDPRRG